jgi:hypothetical protein
LDIDFTNHSNNPKENYLLDFKEAFTHRKKNESFEIIEMNENVRNKSGFILKYFPDATKLIKERKPFNNFKEAVGPYPEVLSGNFKFYDKNENTGEYIELPSNEVIINFIYIILYI